MIQSLLYKEWTKSRRVLLIIVILFAGVMVYSFMNISRSFRVSGDKQVWEMILQKGVVFVEYLKYIPLIAGILIGMVQFIPEMINKRLKLTLHLPLPESKIWLTMLLFGILSLSGIFLITYITTGIGLSFYFCKEIIGWNLSVLQPQLWGGLAGYLLTAWICIEPVWKQRIFNLVIALLFISLYYLDSIPGGYSPLLPWLMVLLLMSISFSFRSLTRFKDGVQS
jgi:hypothetical protein